MTLKEFLAMLAESPRDWRLDEGISIRRGRQDLPEDPISHFGWWGRRQWQLYREAAERLGLPIQLAQQIVEAADGVPGSLRKKLLRACGLKERGLDKLLGPKPPQAARGQLSE